MLQTRIDRAAAIPAFTNEELAFLDGSVKGCSRSPAAFVPTRVLGPLAWEPVEHSIWFDDTFMIPVPPGVYLCRPEYGVHRWFGKNMSPAFVMLMTLLSSQHSGFRVWNVMYLTQKARPYTLSKTRRLGLPDEVLDRAVRFLAGALEVHIEQRACLIPGFQRLSYHVDRMELSWAPGPLHREYLDTFARKASRTTQTDLASTKQEVSGAKN